MSNQDDTTNQAISTLNMANYKAAQDSPGALPDAGADPAQQGALNTAARYGTGANVATDDEGNAGEYSPQDIRTLRHLDYVRGMMAPVHGGAGFLEGIGKAADNEYHTLAGVMSANAKARAAMALQGLKNTGQAGVADIRGGASRDVADINAGAKERTNVSAEDMEKMGYPPGTVGQMDRHNRVFPLYRPPASQVQPTGQDALGNTTYATPGQVITPQQRSANEKYINAAQNVVPYLDETKPDSLFSKLQDPKATSALGGPGFLERAGQGALGLVGSNSSLSPNDTDLRAEIKTFNRQAVQLYKTVPGNENMSPAQLDAFEKDNLPDPDNKLESRTSAFAKMNAFKKMVMQRLGTAQGAMQGHGNYGGGAPSAPATMSGGAPSAADGSQGLPTKEQAIAILAARAAARKQGGQ